ncbi:hypothetical protein B6U70_03255 [Euryarchaeota archaeon ex4484_162]|nr:MAG: hypothetical protein B6U70_03255 [Euryarchaeota archaeon ex4484_162]
MKIKNFTCFIGVFVAAFVMISSATIAQPTVLNKIAVKNVKAKQLPYVTNDFRKALDKTQSFVNKAQKTISKLFPNIDINSIIKKIESQKPIIKNTLKKLVANIKTLTPDKLDNMLKNLKSKIKDLESRIKDDNITSEDIVLITYLIGVLLAAAWGGALGTLLLPGIGTVAGAVLNAIAAGNPFTQIIILYDIIMMFNMVPGLYSDFAFAIVYIFLTALWPLAFVLFPLFIIT